MPDRSSGLDERNITARGAVTRQRIVECAARLMYLQGVSATTLDDVRRAGGVSKSQLYNNFADKNALVHEVVAHHSRNVLAVETERLTRTVNMAGLKRWRDATVAANAAHKGAHGCVLGSMSTELADQDETSRQALETTFATYRRLFVDTFERLRRSGVLRPESNPSVLADGVLSALQGGYVLARVSHDHRRLADAIDAALDHVRSYESSPLHGI